MKRKGSGIWEIKRNPITNITTNSIEDTEIILDHILEWLYGFEAHSGRLPQTEEELKYYLEEAELYKVSVRVDPKVIFYHLLFNHVILIDLDYNITKNLAYNPSLPLLGFVPIDSDKEQFSTNFTRALNNTINWILSVIEIPLSPEEFYMSMERFCVVTCESSLCAIISQLLQRQYIVPQFGGNLEYSLPKISHHLIYEGVCLNY